MLPVQQVKRVFGLLGQLKIPRTINEMAAESGVDAKTIRRDVVRLKQLGFDVRSRTEKYGLKVWYVVKPLATIRGLMAKVGSEIR